MSCSIIIVSAFILFCVFNHAVVSPSQAYSCCDLLVDCCLRANLPVFVLDPVCEYSVESVMHDHYDIRPMVGFPVGGLPFCQYQIKLLGNRGI